jgi:hypothetical protein
MKATQPQAASPAADTTLSASRMGLACVPAVARARVAPLCACCFVTALRASLAFRIPIQHCAVSARSKRSCLHRCERLSSSVAERQSCRSGVLGPILHAGSAFGRSCFARG